MVGNIQLDETLWQRLIELLGAAVVLTDTGGTIQFVNQRFSEVTGYEPDEVIGSTPGILNSGRTPPSLHKQLWSTIEAGRVWRGRILNRKKNGDLYWAMQSIAPVHNRDGQTTRYLSVSDNVEDIFVPNHDHYGFYDNSTGVGNRRLLELDLASELDRGDRLPCELVLIEFANKVGVETIAKTLAERLGELTGQSGIVYRLSLCQFAVLLSRSARAIREFSLTAPELLSEPIALAFDQIRPSLFMGRAYSLSGISDYGSLIKQAEKSLHISKQRDTQGSLFCNDNIEISDKQLFEELCSALDNKAMHIAAQPIIDNDSGDLAALEFLLRWRHPQFGYISPPRIINVAEKYGYLYKVAIYVVHQVLDSLTSSILSNSAVSFTVNFNLPQITNRKLMQDVLDLIDSHGIERSRFIFEVTETEALTIATEDAIGVLDWVRQQGVVLALDDFGAGYSTLDYLSQFQVDLVKLDRSLLSDINTNSRRKLIFRMVLNLCQELGVAVVVEGIETEEQADFVNQLGVDHLLLQGFFFAKPHELIGEGMEMLEGVYAKQSTSH